MKAGFFDVCLQAATTLTRRRSQLLITVERDNSFKWQR